jgi:hypothetical protein
MKKIKISHLEAMSETAGFFIERGNISISLANSLSFFPRGLLKNPLFSSAEIFPFGEVKTARAREGETIWDFGISLNSSNIGSSRPLSAANGF